MGILWSYTSDFATSVATLNFPHIHVGDFVEATADAVHLNVPWLGPAV
jgi:hypothetical protein